MGPGDISYGEFEMTYVKPEQTINVNVTLSLKDGNLNDLALTLVRALNLLVVGPAVEAKTKTAKPVVQHTLHKGKTGEVETESTVRIPASFINRDGVVDNDVLIDLEKPVVKAVKKTQAPKPVVSIMQGNAVFFPRSNTSLELPTMQRRVLGALIRLDNRFPDHFHSEVSILKEAGYPADLRVDHMASLLRRYGFAIESAKTARKRGVNVPKNVTGYRIRPASQFELVGFTGSNTPVSAAAKKALQVVR